MTTDPSESGIITAKAFKHRTFFGTVLKIFLVLLILAVIAGVVIALFFKDTWREIRSFTYTKLEDTRTSLFRHLATKYVEASDLKKEDKNAWIEIVEKMCDFRENDKGTEQQREELRTYFEKIVEAMKDDELRTAELDPIRGDISRLLEEIEKTEKIKQG
jgi:uncharacterized membrane protein YraQ (UPF0718 family)